MQTAHTILLPIAYAQKHAINTHADDTYPVQMRVLNRELGECECFFYI